MSTKFITNENELLSEIINKILPSTNKFYALVGYFYFSGFEQLYKNLADKEVKILIGLDIEKNLLHKIREFEFFEETHSSNEKIKQNFKQSIISLFNDTDFFDSTEKQQAFLLYLKKLKNGTLEIKKTRQANHAKLYIFEHLDKQAGINPGTVITGSSNLTANGLSHQAEINVILRDEYESAYKIFTQLWNNSVPLFDKTNYSEFFQDVVKKTWIEKVPSPYLMYVRVLEELFPLQKNKKFKSPFEISNKYFNLKYQIDAIHQALKIIYRHNGVIIADVVGLGKSIIASVIAHNLRLKTIVIAPPHLINQWNDFRYEFDFNAKVYSSGKIDQALNENDDDEKLIIIDEAHKYRNEETKDYAFLHQLCQGNKIILLSATPFNNRPQDIFSLIKLFQITMKSTIQTVDNLSYQFKKLILEYKKIQNDQKQTSSSMNKEIQNLANKIRDILYPVVIRRSRIDLEKIEEYKTDLKQQKIQFPKIHPPRLLEYDLGDLSHLYINTLEKIAPQEGNSGFIGARYKPVVYLKDIAKYKKEITEEFDDEHLFKQSQINLAKFMKRLLVGRFESSLYAFQKTLNSIISSSENILKWYYEIGQIPIYKKGNLPDIDYLIDECEGNFTDELNKIKFDDYLQNYYEKGLKLIQSKEIKKQFAKDVQHDMDLLTQIRDDWFKNGIEKDPKLENFKNILLEKLNENPKRKIIVFSQYADTVDYLFEQLKNELRIFKYSGKTASPANKQVIKANFDAGLEKQKQKNDYDILIATDAISEGFNLHRAGIIFNYDIPYNPTKVIQRVGRINRINKKVFDELFIYNFFPTETGEIETRVKQISTLKISLIHALLGEDTKVLTKDEELHSFYQKQYNELMTNQEEQSWDVEYKNFLYYIRKTNPALINSSMKIPKRTRIQRRVNKKDKGIVVFAKKGDEHIFKYSPNNNEVITISPQKGLTLFEASITETAKKVSPNFEKIYQNIKKNLFKKTTQIKLDRGIQETIDKIAVLKEVFPEKKQYLEDLRYIFQDLDSLPLKFAKQIRAINEKNLIEDMEKLEQDAPHSYLMKIIDTAKKIDDKEESLIFSEEII